jgi:hypothetical protein
MVEGDRQLHQPRLHLPLTSLSYTCHSLAITPLVAHTGVLSLSAVLKLHPALECLDISLNNAGHLLLV